MTRLLKLMFVAVLLGSLTGCSSGWPRWMCRGDNCDSCAQYGSGLMTSPSLMSPTYVTPPTELPGPINASPST